MFSHPWALWCLLALPLLSLLGAWAGWRSRRLLARLGDRRTLLPLLTARPGRRRGRGVVQWLGLLLLALAAAGPQWGRDENVRTATGRDVVVVLDLSRSLLAEQPSRLERARRMLADLADGLARRGGHRLALVVFAGRARVVCPLTKDYDHFREAVAGQDAAHPPPELRPTGVPSGTRFGAALEAAVGLHDPAARGSQDVLLLSDGDDPVPDGEWLAGVTAARRAGIAVDVVGVGDDAEPHRIPAGPGFLSHAGAAVETRLREDLLTDLARRTEGVYFPARTRTLPLGTLYRELLDARGREREASAGTVPVYTQRYAWFLLPALVLWTLALLLNDGKPWQNETKSAEAGRPE